MRVLQVLHPVSKEVCKERSLNGDFDAFVLVHGLGSKSTGCLS
jgi:hypothetical protein